MMNFLIEEVEKTFRCFCENKTTKRSFYWVNFGSKKCSTFLTLRRLDIL